MLKKRLAILLSTTLCLNLVACAGSKDHTNQDAAGTQESASGNYGENADASSEVTPESSVEASMEIPAPTPEAIRTTLDMDGDGIVVESELSLDVIEHQCNVCHDALVNYINLVTEAYEQYDDLDSKYEDYDRVKRLPDTVNSYMRTHECTAETVYVQDIPYSYYGAYGYYTGEWKGAGPNGKGSFSGTDVWKNAIVTYDGDWAYGLPEGYGKFYVGNFNGHYWDMTYYGDMKDGKRHGNGHWMESGTGNMLGTGTVRYRIYDTSVFENDVMTKETKYEEYTSEDELLSYGSAIGSPDGWIMFMEKHEAGELTALQTAGFIIGVTVLTIAFMNVLSSDETVISSSAVNPNSVDALNAAVEEKKKKDEADEKRRAEEAEKQRKEYERKAYECMDKGDYYSLDYQKYSYRAGLRWDGL